MSPCCGTCAHWVEMCCHWAEAHPFPFWMPRATYRLHLPVVDADEGQTCLAYHPDAAQEPRGTP